MTEKRDRDAELMAMYAKASPAMRQALLELVQAFCTVADIQRAEQKEAQQ